MYGKGAKKNLFSTTHVCEGTIEVEATLNGEADSSLTAKFLDHFWAPPPNQNMVL